MAWDDGRMDSGLESPLVGLWHGETAHTARGTRSEGFEDGGLAFVVRTKPDRVTLCGLSIDGMDVEQNHIGTGSHEDVAIRVAMGRRRLDAWCPACRDEALTMWDRRQVRRLARPDVLPETPGMP